MTSQDTMQAASDRSRNVIITAIRYVLIGAAGMSLVGLSIHALGLHYSDVFVDALRNLKDLIGWTSLFEFLERLIKLASAYLSFPKFHLGEWWRDTFVLLWLLSSSIARNAQAGWRVFVLLLLIGIVPAFLAAIATGTAPLNSYAVMAWPIAGMMLYGLLFSLVDSGLKWLNVAAFGGVGLFLAVVGQVIVSPMESLFGVVVPSPGILWLAGSIFALGVFWMFSGLTAARPSPIFLVGRDILIVYAIASALAIAGLAIA